jgi:hypothetical protein
VTTVDRNEVNEGHSADFDLEGNEGVSPIEDEYMGEVLRPKRAFLILVSARLSGIRDTPSLNLSMNRPIAILESLHKRRRSW